MRNDKGPGRCASRPFLDSATSNVEVNPCGFYAERPQIPGEVNCDCDRETHVPLVHRHAHRADNAEYQVGRNRFHEFASVVVEFAVAEDEDSQRHQRHQTLKTLSEKPCDEHGQTVQELFKDGHQEQNACEHAPFPVFYRAVDVALSDPGEFRPLFLGLAHWWSSFD